MTKAELIKALEQYPDDTKIFVRLDPFYGGDHEARRVEPAVKQVYGKNFHEEGGSELVKDAVCIT